MATRPALYFLIGTINISPDLMTPVPNDPGLEGSQQRFMWNASHNPFELTEVADYYECITIDYPASMLEAQYSHNVGKANLIAAINARPGPFAMAGMSQGAGVISDVYNELRSGSLVDRRADFIRGLAAGNPWREEGTTIPGGMVQPGHGMAGTNLVGTEPSIWWELAAQNDIVCTNDDSPMGLLVTASYEWTYGNYTGAEAGLWSALEATFSGEPFNTLSTAVNYWLRAFGYLSADNPHLSYMTYRPRIGDNRSGIDIAAADLIELAKLLGVGPSAASIGWFAENYITLNGVASAAAVGTPALSSGQALRLNAVASASVVGVPKLIQQQFINLSSVASDAAIGTPAVSWPQSITLVGKGSDAGVGTPYLTPAQSVVLNGVPSDAAVGTLHSFDQSITLNGVASASGAGAPNLVPGGVAMTLNGVASAAAVGTPAIHPGTVAMTLTGVASAAAVSPLDSIANVFTPISYENTNLSAMAWPPGATEWRFEGLGAAGGSGSAAGSSFSTRSGGAGSGGGAKVDSGWQAKGSATTVTAIRGIGGAQNTDGGNTTFSTSDGRTCTAGGGKKGNIGVTSGAPAGGAGGVASVSGITATTLADGSAGGAGGNASGTAGVAGGDNANGAGPGGGGGGGRSNVGGTATGGRGGNSTSQTGATAGAVQANGNTGGSPGMGLPGGGGSGAGSGNQMIAKNGGAGGDYGAGAGGAGGENTNGSGNTGGDGYMKVSFR